MTANASIFQAGRTYLGRSPCDYDCTIAVTVAARTAKTLRTQEGKTLRITTDDRGEYVKPWGSYSMSPIVRAK